MAYHTRLKPKSISALKTIGLSILLCHVTRCTNFSVYRATPDQRSAHPDRQINLQIKPITAEGSVHPRSNGSQPSAAPMYHATVHIVAQSQSLSLLSPAILSLIRSPNSGRLKPPNYHRKVTRLLYRKTRPVSVFSLPYLAGKRPRFSSATRSFKSTILPHQPSTAIETTVIRILSIISTRINHLLTGNLAKKVYRLQQ